MPVGGCRVAVVRHGDPRRLHRRGVLRGVGGLCLRQRRRRGALQRHRGAFDPVEFSQPHAGGPVLRRWRAGAGGGGRGAPDSDPARFLSRLRGGRPARRRGHGDFRHLFRFRRRTRRPAAAHGGTRLRGVPARWRRGAQGRPQLPHVRLRAVARRGGVDGAAVLHPAGVAGPVDRPFRRHPARCADRRRATLQPIMGLVGRPAGQAEPALPGVQAERGGARGDPGVDRLGGWWCAGNGVVRGGVFRARRGRRRAHHRLSRLLDGDFARRPPAGL